MEPNITHWTIKVWEQLLPLTFMAFIRLGSQAIKTLLTATVADNAALASYKLIRMFCPSCTLRSKMPLLFLSSVSSSTQQVIRVTDSQSRQDSRGGA